MHKIDILGFEDWNIYEGFAEGSGRGEKIWLQSSTGEIGLFKFPKIDPASSVITTEYISEHLACRLGLLLNVETAKIDIGVRNQRLGCMSYLLNQSDEAIVEGSDFIIGLHPDYDPELMIETNSGKHYCLDYLFEISDNYEIRFKMIQMMLFDYLIGNSDRHQNNWAMLVSYADHHKQLLKARFCPLYDNGSSLCSYITASQALNILGNDKTRFNAVVDTKSRSLIRINGNDKKRPTHVEMASYLIKEYPEAVLIADSFISKLTENLIDELVDSYSELIENEKMELLKRFLKRKIYILNKLRNEAL